MKSITFHGAAGTVTGSSYLLKHEDGTQLLVDFGMFQGPEEVSALNAQKLHFNPAELTQVLLTHAHLDHCGRLPLLMQQGFKGRIFLTEPTLDMLYVALHDAARIAQYDDKIPVLYTEEDVERLLQNVEVIDYDEEFSVGPFKIIYRDAGHILGSASIEVTDTRSDTMKKIVFSGDLGNYPHAMLESPYMFDEADLVIMESTYGGRMHGKDDAFAILEKEIKAVQESGGVLMIPSFAIERTQEILYILKQLKDTARVPLQIPVYLDSPMAIKVTEIYKRYGALYKDNFSDSLQKFDPFTFANLHMLERSKDGRVIEKDKGPKVIIAGSGMMSGGRILKHAHKYISKPANRILFVGYQGEETLGRAILEGAAEVKINEVDLPVKASIAKIESLSAHADEGQLLNWVKHINGVSRVVLSHGEDDAREILAPKVTSETGISDVQMPQLYDEMKLD